LISFHWSSKATLITVLLKQKMKRKENEVNFFSSSHLFFYSCFHLWTISLVSMTTLNDQIPSFSYYSYSCSCSSSSSSSESLFLKLKKNIVCHVKVDHEGNKKRSFNFKAATTFQSKWSMISKDFSAFLWVPSSEFQFNKNWSHFYLSFTKAGSIIWLYFI